MPFENHDPPEKSRKLSFRITSSSHRVLETPKWRNQRISQQNQKVFESTHRNARAQLPWLVSWDSDSGSDLDLVHPARQSLIYEFIPLIKQIRLHCSHTMLGISILSMGCFGQLDRDEKLNTFLSWSLHYRHSAK